MLSLQEVEAAVDAMPVEQQQHVLNHLMARMNSNADAPATPTNSDRRQHILDVPPVSLGGLKSASPKSVSNGQGGHSVLDIPSFSMGEILKPFSSDDDLLEEMLEDRRF